MKHKVLINGRNSLRVADFIQHTEAFFDTLSTSSCLQDIVGHFRFFDPSVYICFVEPEYEQTLDQINELKGSQYYNGAVIVIIGDLATCDKIERKTDFTANLIIRRPVTPDNLALRITRYLDERAAKQQHDQQAIAAEMAANEERAVREAQAALQAAVQAAEAAKQAAAPAAEVSDKKHILVVDDDRTVLKMLKSALEESYEVTTMINGMMVDKLLASKTVDLILLDYEMPMETGADIFRRIKNNPAAVDIPVCFLTGVTDREKIMEVMSLKPHGYLLKPIDVDMMITTVKNLIG
ncbi:MAG: response regulator [Oscillospiraceae bacterium]|nr:response regulator [Oscillospiraceae bacterium]